MEHPAPGMSNVDFTFVLSWQFLALDVDTSRCRLMPAYPVWHQPATQWCVGERGVDCHALIPWTRMCGSWRGYFLLSLHVHSALWAVITTFVLLVQLWAWKWQLSSPINWKCMMGIMIIMVIFKCYFSREHIALHMKNGVKIELGNINRLKALCMMQDHTWNKQTMCQQTKTKHEKKAFVKISSKKKRCIIQTDSIR